MDPFKAEGRWHLTCYRPRAGSWVSWCCLHLWNKNKALGPHFYMGGCLGFHILKNATSLGVGRSVLRWYQLFSDSHMTSESRFVHLGSRQLGQGLWIQAQFHPVPGQSRGLGSSCCVIPHSSQYWRQAEPLIRVSEKQGHQKRNALKATDTWTKHWGGLCEETSLLYYFFVILIGDFFTNGGQKP